MTNNTPSRLFVKRFQDIRASQIGLVGGKAANLAELTRIGDVLVPDGFCITTEAFKKSLRDSGSINTLLGRLAVLKTSDKNGISELSAEIRRIIEDLVLPQELIEEVSSYLSQIGEKTAYAIRSSATAEDLPEASFAGQQDSYLNIIGRSEILKHISRCWASLFTERAVMYRIQNGIDHRTVYMSVVIQKMVFAESAGILFTADPVSSNRRILSIDAGFGLGEAMVSGLVNADNYKLRDDRIIVKKISAKKLAIYAQKGGGIKSQEIDSTNQNTQVLSDEQILELAQIGKRIEKHFANPRDIEWCLADDQFYIVQSRPITTLFPIPARPGEPDPNDTSKHIYISVGHQQMMTGAIKPLGLSFFLLTTSAPMRTAGGRLFVDVMPQLSSPASRDAIIDLLGKSDPLIKDALLNITQREDFFKSSPDDQAKSDPSKNQSRTLAEFQTVNDYDPAIVHELIKRRVNDVDILKKEIDTKSGSDLFDFILEDIQQLKRVLTDPQSFGVFMTAMNASYWLNEKMNEWLGEPNAADVLSQSVPNNITSEMGLALLDVADVIRAYPQVIHYLEEEKNDRFPEGLEKVHGGRESLDAFNAFLEIYGMRCVGEIDITRTRWSENPLTLVPVILSHIKNMEPGASHRKFEAGKQEALKKEQEFLNRLMQLPDGEQKVREAKRMIDLTRNLIGYREYPKYHMVSRYFVYKEALMKAAGPLVQAGIIHEKEDIFYLSFEELREVIIKAKVDYQIITKRKDEYRLYKKLTPPRVITSDGEIITGAYKRENLPTGALAGLAVSSGVIEGRARVILQMEDAALEEGDILVTSFTDPSWTTLFVSIKGLVTEVGGLMTHGAVIAREYGLPAVVGVENATTLIKDGDRIRVNGTEGYVEIL